MNTTCITRGAMSTKTLHNRENIITVKWWSVSRNTIEDGRRILNAPLSPPLSSRNKARTALKDLRHLYPDAVIGRSDAYFNRLRAGDVEIAQSLRATIQ